MNCQMTVLLLVAVCGVISSPGRTAHADVAISVNLFSNRGDLPSDAVSMSVNTAVGSETAGVVAVGNWNDIPANTAVWAGDVDYPLRDSSGADTGLTFRTAFLPEQFWYYGSACVADDSASFAGAGDEAMMRGYAYEEYTGSLYAVMAGRIPFETFDLYVYCNSNLNNSQIISLNTSGVTVGDAQTVMETPGTDTAYALSAAGSVGNYVKFTGLRAADFHTDTYGYYMTIQADSSSDTDGYGYINGFQLVDTTVPESATLCLLLGGAIPLLIRRYREKR
ncbi:MAG: hypothetical protein JXM70_22970 [Pirellulales bacterium]|nr:hypothetical protein [Pirellulales bacterium]